MKTKGYKRRSAARRNLRQHVVAIASSPLGREIAMAAVMAVATAISTTDPRHGLFKRIGRNLRQAVIDQLSPVIDELLHPEKRQAAAAE